MKDTHKDQKYTIADSFMLRVPLLSMDVLIEISDCKSIEALLKKYYGLPVISEALYLASPALHKLTDTWLNGGNELSDQEKLKYSLMKYLIRMSSRCTPFGLFAGMCTGSFGEDTNILLFPTEKHSLFLRPDMQYLCSAASKLLQDTELRKKIAFYQNTSLWKAGGEYRYIEYFTTNDHIRKYQLQATAHSPELSTILDVVEKGASREVLAQLLCSEEIGEEEACAYVDALIDNQVLVSELEPAISGPGFFGEILNAIKIHGIENELSLSLEKFNETVNKLNSNGAGRRIQAFKSIQHNVSKTEMPFDERALIQGDMKIGFHSCKLDASIRPELQDAVSVLMKLSRPSDNSLLSRFKEDFLRRYEMSEVPLQVALDPEAGPGYLPVDKTANISALLHGIKLPQKKSITREIRWNQVDAFLFRKLQDTLLKNSKQIEIAMQDLDDMNDSSQSFPMSFSVLARIGGKWGKDKHKNLIHIVAAGGNSAAALAGRFCHIDEDLHKAIADINVLEQEISGDTILAEIVHLPQQRTGNVLMRPFLRKYEIPYLARSILQEEYVIPISDLMLSVRHDRFMLRSKRLNKFIIPRMSNAHNYSMGSLAVYRFLCDMQSQDTRTSLSFSWGPLENEILFLPRVCHKNFVLQPATWNLRKSDMAEIKNAADENGLRQAINKLREKFHIPREIVVAESDNELWLDLESIHCLELFKHEVRDKQHIRLQEYLFDHDNDGIIKSDDGAHANEFVFFFHHQPDTDE